MSEESNMSQDLHFCKQMIFREEILQEFTHDQINSTMKSLLKERNLEEDTNLRNKFFEEIEIYSFSISGYDDKIEKILKESVFLSLDSRLLMVTESLWQAIKTIVEDKEKELQSNHDKEESLSQCKQDYSNIKELFDKKLLCINIY
jgi:hypothetical protein